MARAKPSDPSPVEATSKNQNILTIRGKQAWKDWLDRYAASRRVNPTVMIDLALTESASKDGFEPPPPRL